MRCPCLPPPRSLAECCACTCPSAPGRSGCRCARPTAGSTWMAAATACSTRRTSTRCASPRPAWAAVVIAETVASGELAYTPYRGHPGVLDSLAATLGGVLGVPLSPAENLALTPGTQVSLFATLFCAWLDEGDLVLAADPDYLFNERILAFLGARVQRVPVVFDDDGAPRLDLAALAQACAQRPGSCCCSPTRATRRASAHRRWDDPRDRRARAEVGLPRGGGLAVLPPGL